MSAIPGFHPIRRSPRMAGRLARVRPLPPGNRVHPRRMPAKSQLATASHALQHEYLQSLPALDRPPIAATESTLIVGAGDGGKLLLREMQRNLSWSFLPVAFVDDDPRKIGARIHGVPVIGAIDDIPTIVDREAINVVVIAIPSAADATLNRIAEIARQSSARVLTMPNIGALLRGEATVRSLRAVTIDDVLGRPAISPNLRRCRRFVTGRRAMITGAAGSIGLEVTRQVARLKPELIVAVDINESGLFDLCQEIQLGIGTVNIQPVVASVTNRSRLAALFERFRPDIVFHAAAYKHVPLMEEWPEEAIMVNAVGSLRVAQAAADAGVDRFVLVSTDKAVRPSSVMGATKRLAELAVRVVGQETGLSTCCVRFGNVLGSRGSVIPIFERQINAGGPVTVTDRNMKRYFMTIPEAASLIIEAGALGDPGVIYMLQMGEEVSILDLAKRMIRLSGRQEGRDIDIIFTGLRPGEKLREELSFPTELSLATDHPKIRLLRDAANDRPSSALLQDLERIEEAARAGNPEFLRPLLFEIIGIEQDLYRFEQAG
jgi:FlaA1/EpsC-like NDP-sugar epimerase